MDRPLDRTSHWGEKLRLFPYRNRYSDSLLLPISSPQLLSSSSLGMQPSSWPTPLLSAQPRIDEIQKWLADHAPACKRWAALDDLDLLEGSPTSSLRAHIVRTSLTEGLTSDAAEECVAKLTAVQAPSPSPAPPASVLPLKRQESTAEERIEWAGRPGAAAAGARAASGWGSHAALAELGAAYARKRLCSEPQSKQPIAEASDLSLAQRLVSSVLAQRAQRTQRSPCGGQARASDGPAGLRGPTATQQLLALLSAAVPAHANPNPNPNPSPSPSPNPNPNPRPSPSPNP